jgi:hypothetical protein
VDRDYILYTGRYNDNLYWKDCETWIDYWYFKTINNIYA